MRSFATLVAIEARRALSRRAVWVLIGIALIGIVLTGVIGFVASDDFDPTRSDPDIARLNDLWMPGGGDGALTATLFFLAIGAVLGGATVTGAEWQHGTIVTTCTWEARRRHLLLARLFSAALLAAVIALALQVLFCLALVPTYLLRGSTEVDSGFWPSLVGAIVRIAAVTGLATTLGATLASIGRRTTVALGFAFAYIAVVEAIVRGNWPHAARWLIGENTGIVITNADLEGAAFTRGTGLAAVTLVGYIGVLVLVALELFRRRDLASTA